MFVEEDAWQVEFYKKYIPLLQKYVFFWETVQGGVRQL